MPTVENQLRELAHHLDTKFTDVEVDELTPPGVESLVGPPVRLELGAQAVKQRQRFYRVRQSCWEAGDVRFTYLKFQISGNELSGSKSRERSATVALLLQANGPARVDQIAEVLGDPGQVRSLFAD